MNPSSLPRRGNCLCLATGVLLLSAYATGGGSFDRGVGDAATQLVACLVLALACARLLHPAEPPPRALRVALVLAALVPAGLLFQILGGTSKTPWATERGLWALLPGLGAFVAAVALPRRQQVPLAWTIVLAATASLVLGLLQLGAPQDSILNPFPQWQPALNGFFANQNHQATGIGIALVLLAAWAFDPRRRTHARHARAAGLVAVAGLAVLLLVALPIVGSRAMTLISLGALLLVPVGTGWLAQRLERREHSRQGTFLLLGGMLAAACLLAAVSAWVKTDYASGTRIAMARNTAALAAEAMPWGTGVGSFVQWYDAHTPDQALQWAYVNHAHNEYAQWWLESGVLGLAWIAVLAAGMAWSFPRRAWRGEAGDWLATGSWLAVAVVLAHSIADYPLRTPAIMTVAAFLGGVAVRAAAQARDGDPAPAARASGAERPA